VVGFWGLHPPEVFAELSFLIGKRFFHNFFLEVRYRYQLQKTFPFCKLNSSLLRVSSLRARVTLAKIVKITFFRGFSNFWPFRFHVRQTFTKHVLFIYLRHTTFTSKVFRALHPFGYGGSLKITKNRVFRHFSNYLILRLHSPITTKTWIVEGSYWHILVKKSFSWKSPDFEKSASEVWFWSESLTPQITFEAQALRKSFYFFQEKSHTLLSPLPRFSKKKVFYERVSLIFKTSICEFAQIMGFWDPENDILSSGSKYIGAAVLKQSLVYVSSLYVSFILLKFWLNRFLKVRENENVISASNSKELGQNDVLSFGAIHVWARVLG